jgi:hypothetical protein
MRISGRKKRGTVALQLVTSKHFVIMDCITFSVTNVVNITNITSNLAIKWLTFTEFIS